MFFSPSKIVLLVFLNAILLSKSQEVKTEARDFHSYLPPDENINPDYQIFHYPHNYPFKEEYVECVKNPMLPILGKGLNLILLKLGVFGIIKAIVAIVFAGFLINLPLLFLKIAFLKSFFLPLFLIPLFSHMNQSTNGETENKPGEKPEEMPSMMMGMNEMAMDMGRQLNDNLTTVAWQSVKMFAESDQCVEKISCIIGASSRDSSFGNLFTRILKYLHYSSPPSLQKRVASIKEAFNKGSSSSACFPEDYECQSPELLLQYGMKKIKIL